LEGDSTTDVIVEKEDGEQIHYYIADNHPAIVHIRVGGTVRVKRADTITPIKRAIMSLTKKGSETASF
jgi:hypothetical protein